ERKTQRVALNLDVAFLHDVEQADLDFSGKVGEFVDGEDPPVGARQQTVVNGELVRQIAAPARGADGVNVPDNVGDSHVGSGQFFDVAKVARHPGDGRTVPVGGDALAASPADGLEGIVVDFAAGDDREFRSEGVDEPAENAALGLAAEPQKDEVVPREQSIDDLRDHRVVITLNAGEKRFAAFDRAQQVGADFVFDRTRSGASVQVRNTAQF